MSNESIEQVIADRFDEYGSEPTPVVWEGIEAFLDEEPSRKLPIIFWWIANAAIIAVILGATVYTQRDRNMNLQQIMQNQQTSSDTKSNEANITEVHKNSITGESSSVNETPEKLTQNGNQGHESVPVYPNKSFVPTPSPEQGKNETRKPKLTEVEPPISPAIPRETSSPIGTLATIDLMSIRYSLTPSPLAYFRETPVPSIYWQTGIRVSQFIRVGSLQKSSGQSNFVEYSSTDTTGGGGGTITSVPEESIPSTPYESARRLFEVEGYVRRTFADRFNLGVGLSLAYEKREKGTLTVNEITPSSTSYNSLVTQSNAYWMVGIPVRASYSFIKNGLWEVSAGYAFQPEIALQSLAKKEVWTAPTTDPALASSSQSTFLMLNGQPYVRGSYGISLGKYHSFMEAFLEAGYRSRYRDRTGFSKPNYITLSAGIAWNF